MADKKPDDFDVRTVERKIAAGIFSGKDYKKSLGELPDSGENAEFVPVDEEESEQPPAGESAAGAEGSE